MTRTLAVTRAAVGALDSVRSRFALRGATHVGAGVRVLGRPYLVNGGGQLSIGASASILATPSPVELTVGPGARLILGERSLVESGASILARGSIWVGQGVRIGAGCILDDESGGEISVGDGAWIENGAVLLGGTKVPAGAIVAGSAASGSSARPPVPASADSGVVRDADVDRRLRVVLSRVVAATSSVEPTTELTQVKGWDSLAALRVLVALEKEFAVILPTNLFADRPSLESVAPIIAASVAKHAGAG